MSLILYRLGRFVSRHAWWVVAGWLAVLVAGSLAVGSSGRPYDDSFTIPGSPSQDGMTVLTSRFPQAAGASAQIVFTVPEGDAVTDEPYVDEIGRIIAAVGDVPQVASVSNPVSTDKPGVISSDGESALAQVQFTVQNSAVEQSSLDGVVAAAVVEAGPADRMGTLVGGTAYAPGSAHSSAADVIGIVAAFLVLLTTFGSLLAAGMPLITAIMGVVVTDSLIGVASTLTPVNSTAPVLALMIGLAVGIDYALFILSRHRRQLAEGLPPGESVARTLGTAGSAVVFAGVTVVIALCGLAVADIPFLTVMGLCAAAGVAASVLVSLTLLPALASILGTRLAPRRSKRRSARAVRLGRVGFAQRWVSLVTRRPLITIPTVLVVLGTLSLPAFSLSMALDDNGSAPVGSAARATYDAVAAEFGPGYNAPLLVVGNVITSTDPLGDVSAFAAEIAGLPGVAAVGQATPNQGADTALVQVIPEGPQSSSETTELVQSLRDVAPALGAQHHITDVQITGQTAISIDVSDRLGGALLPFGLVVVGLSLVLLTVVFRSILVPIKATVGYVLSVGVAFGVVTAVFNWGWGADLIGVADVGPVISFLPIIVMGVLFGLAMDYEVFLVSRIREDYTRTKDAQGAIRRGFVASAPVVTAAGIIMVSVFTAFVPTGSPTIKPIAVALAVGVFVDAFIVRMTLVPAVLALLGRHAWWLPGWLECRLPSLDIEGEAVEHAVELHDAAGRPPLLTRDLVVDDAPGAPALSLLVPDGRAVQLAGLDSEMQAALALIVAGRHGQVSGDASVQGLLTPHQATLIQRRVAIVDLSSIDRTGMSVGDYISDRLREQSWVARAAAHRVDAVVSTVDELFAEVSASGHGQHTRRSVPQDTALHDLTPAERIALECALAEATRALLIVVINLDRLATSTQRRDVAETTLVWVRRRVSGALLTSRERVSECDDLGIADAFLSPDFFAREMDPDTPPPACDDHPSSAHATSELELKV